MTVTTVDLTELAPIGRGEARALAEVEYRRITDELAALDPDDWHRPTDCDMWTVRDLAGHVLGAMRSAASFVHNAREMAATMRRTRRLGGPMVDHMTAIQVETTAALSTDELVAECRSLVERAAAGRYRVPGPLRRLVKVPVDVPGLTETWSLGYLVDTILTRDTWLHRVDLARATGRPMQLTGDHDGRIVGDVAREWARRHGRPVRLTLTGPAGGDFVAGAGATLELDAVEFCRIVSRRAAGEGLLAQAVPF
jgi:uncharacterized protein (TIGR03083 family)